MTGSKKLDYAQLAVALMERIKASGIISTAQLALDAKNIQDRIQWYLETDTKLAKKYGVE